MTVQAVSQWENGKTDPKSRLGPLSEALVVDPSWLACEIDGPSDKSEDEVIESGINIPLIDFRDLAYFLHFINNDPVIVTENYLRSTVDPIGKLFAIRILHPNKFFCRGDILIFDNGIEPVKEDFAAILIFNDAFAQMSAIKNANALASVVTGSVARISAPASGEGSNPRLVALTLDEAGKPIERQVVVVATLVEHRKFRRDPLKPSSDDA